MKPTKSTALIVSLVAATALGTACTTTASNQAGSKLPAIVVVPVPVPPAVAKPAPDSHSTRNSVDWEGYYTGTIPCASCEGIQMWLKLSDSGKTTRYDLIENYLGEKNGVFRSTGNAVWRANGSVIDLKGKDENRALFIGENFAELLGADQNRAKCAPSVAMAKRSCVFQPCSITVKLYKAAINL